MKILCGKLDDLYQSQAAPVVGETRVPIVSIAFKPIGSSGSHELLCGGGSAVSLWTINSSENVTEAAAAAAPEERVNQDVGDSDRWLHAKHSSIRLSARRLGYYVDHSHHYILRVSWSKSGQCWASADNRQIFIWREKQADIWTRHHSILEASISEIFDFCWVGDDRIAIGGMERVLIRRIPSNSGIPCTEAPGYIELSDSAITKGITSAVVPSCNGTTRTLIAVATNTKRALVFEIMPDNSTRLIFSDGYLFRDSPADTPLLRHCCFDPSGTTVAFALGERKANCFGCLYHVTSTEIAVARRDSNVLETLVSSSEQQQPRETEPNDQEFSHHDLLRDSKFRLRGHQTRVNSIAFGHSLWKWRHCPSKLVSKLDPNDSQDCELLNVISESQSIAFSAEKWPKYVRLAQASVDGCLSIWNIFLPLIDSSENSPVISGLCFSVAPATLVDQAGLITDLSWSWNDEILAVASDDGKLTCFQLKENNFSSDPTENLSFQDSNDKSPVVVLTPRAMHEVV